MPQLLDVHAIVLNTAQTHPSMSMAPVRPFRDGLLPSALALTPIASQAIRLPLLTPKGMGLDTRPVKARPHGAGEITATGMSTACAPAEV